MAADKSAERLVQTLGFLHVKRQGRKTFRQRFTLGVLEKAVVVKIADRQWRYSRFPELPLFGRAARESRIESLHAERETLSERFATLSFDVQKTQRLH
ncbi:hypothetical protein, partial [Enterobacter asburiae]|uniref:hypothetical protein n=1 Tax=Enterobacter asburiae TaxID=61645 RepID=UPI001E2F6F4C